MASQHHPWLAPIVLGLLALAVRSAHLDQVAHFDELYHLLAARSWLAEGSLEIAEGSYERTPLFTKFIAGWFALFGESLIVARLPSVLAGALLVVVVFLWTRREAGSAAAWVAALLLALWSEAIEISQFARFYALHGLLVFCGAIAVYAAVEGRAGWGMRAGSVLAAAGAFLLALNLQITTLIVLAGLGLWFAAAVMLPWLARRPPAWRWGIVLPATALFLAVALVATRAGLDEVVWQAMFGTPLWSARHEGRFWYYHGLFSLGHPLLWSLIAAAALFAVAHRPRPALFCLVLFATAFLVHSISARKHVRYIYYAMPFLFVLGGIAAQDVLPRVWAALKGAAGRATAALGGAPRPRLSMALAGFACAFVLAAQPDLVRTVAGLGGIYLPPEEPRPQWDDAGAVLAPWLARADVVLTTGELEALYYLGRFDLVVSKTRLSELGDQREFARDPRTGRPVITTPEAVARVMDCFETGLVVSSEERWRGVNHLDDAVADLVVRRAEEIPLPSGQRMRAYYWEHEVAPAPGRCAELPEPSGAARA